MSAPETAGVGTDGHGPAASRAGRAGGTGALGTLLGFGRRHRGLLAAGGLSTIGVVAMRLALPWPLRGLMEAVFPMGGGEPLGRMLPSGVDPIFFYCGSYLILALGSGVFDLLQRVWFTRYAAATVHDLRAAAVAGVRASGGLPGGGRGDLVTRIIGDSARLKADLKGILIHASQNGLLVVAVTALFLFLSPKLGVLFLAGACLAVLIGALALDDVAEHARKQRSKESRYASLIQEGQWGKTRKREKEVNRASARRDVRTTRIIGTSAVLIHAALAVTISLALWVGVRDVRAGRLAPGELFLFVAYALTVHHRAVRVGRQIARGGKLLACAERICSLIVPAGSGTAGPWSLTEAIRLEGVGVASAGHLAGGWRLRRIDLDLRAGVKTAVLGVEGSGKTTLLAVLAGAVAPDEGRVVWDGRDVTDPSRGLRRSVEHVGQAPALPPTTLRGALGIEPGGTLDEGHEDLLRSLGVHRLAGKLRKGADQKLRAGDLSVRERRALRLCSLAVSRAPVWLLDEPEDCGGTAGRSRLEALLGLAGEERTVIVALRKPCLLERFDTVVVLKKGRVRFRGTPSEWKAWRAGRGARRDDGRARKGAAG